MITVRTALPEDFESVSSLGRRAFYEAFGEYNKPEDMQAYLDLSFNPETIKQQLEDPEVIFFIASYQDDPVGYAKLKRNSAPPELQGKKCIQLERIYALKAYIGKKIGKALMESCLETSKQEGFDYLWLGVWQQNKRAIDFYKKFNLETIGVKKFKIGNQVTDDYVMAIKIQEIIQ